MLLGFYLLLGVLHVTKGCSLTDNKKTSKVTAHVGDTVLLPCSCAAQQSPASMPTWRKINKLTNDWDSVTLNQKRFQLSNVQVPGNLSLLISHLTVEDDGLYRCQIRIDDYTDINLSVQEGSIRKPPDTMSMAFLSFIPVVLLLLGLGGVIFWRCRARKREQTPSSEGLTGQKNDEETEGKEQETQDDVTYTTVVPTDTAQRPKVVSPEERTEYAVIKLNQ